MMQIGLVNFMEEELYSKFSENPLLQGLTKGEMRNLFLKGNKVSIKTNQTLITEGDHAKELFFLLKGFLQVTKRDPQTGGQYGIATLGPGDLVGEMALIDKGPRSATVKAETDAELISVAFSELEVELDTQTYPHKMFIHVARNLSERLRKTSDRTVEALQKQVEEYENRLLLGNLLVMIISFICAYFYALGWIRDYTLKVVATTYVTLPFSAVFLLGMVWYVRKFHIPLKVFGITTDHWKRSTIEGILFALPVMVVYLALRILVTYWGADISPGWRSLFAFHYTWIDLTVYPFIVAPLQELLARGGIQGMLNQLLIGKYRTAQAIFASSLIFGACHLFLSFSIAFGVFFLSLYLGVLYSRVQNLIGVSIAHAVIGLWILNIVGYDL
jgi:CRP-like cAMP-binding protein